MHIQFKLFFVFVYRKLSQRADPVVSFQLRHFKLLAAIFWFILPVCTGVYLLGESLATCVLANCWRYVISLHNTWLVNSLAHVHGARPFNRHIEPRENKFVVITFRPSLYTWSPNDSILRRRTYHWVRAVTTTIIPFRGTIPPRNSAGGRSIHWPPPSSISSPGSVSPTTSRCLVGRWWRKKLSKPVAATSCTRSGVRPPCSTTSSAWPPSPGPCGASPPRRQYLTARKLFNLI